MIDLNTYRHSCKPQIKAWCDARPDKVPADMLSEIALATSCPLIAVGYYIQELYGPNVTLDTTIQRLIKWYNETVTGELI